VEDVHFGGEQRVDECHHLVHGDEVAAVARKQAGRQRESEGEMPSRFQLCR
jgi:hypothetical protein